jgi:NADH-quinone oxidoreductase subunit N
VSSSDYIAALPLIILAATGLLVMLWDAFEKKPSRAPFVLSVLGSLSAAFAAFQNIGHNGFAFGGLFFDTSFSNFFSIVFSVATFLAVLLGERYLRNEEVLIGEFCALILFAATGMIMMASGANLIVTFLGLETMSIAFYVLSGMFRRRSESNEAALKYFLLGAFATGFFLYGIALIYGSYGTLSLEKMHAAGGTSGTLVLLGSILLFIGLAFKVAAFPFHQWAPDVYEGAPTVVSGYMSTAGKAAAFSALVLIYGYALSPAGSKLQTLIAIVAAASMLYGNIVAISQKKIKRMLAYSSTAHAGYILLGIASMNEKGMTGIAIYSAVYMLMQTAAFGVVSILEKETGRGLDLDDYAGLAKRRPWLALLMTVIMFSLAGIPPFAGFFGKYYLFLAALEANLTWLAIAGVVSSIIAAYFYLRVIVLMYFREGEQGVEVKEEKSFSLVAVGLASLALLVLGLLPSSLLEFTKYIFAK